MPGRSSPDLHHPRQKYCAKMSNTIALYAPFPPSCLRCLIPFSYPLSNFTFRCVISTPGNRDSPDLLMRPTVPKRHNLKKIHQSRLAYSASKITMRTLACDARSRVSSSYTIMVIPTSSCSRLPTLSSSCMYSSFLPFFSHLRQLQVLVIT